MERKCPSCEAPIAGYGGVMTCPKCLEQFCGNCFLKDPRGTGGSGRCPHCRETFAFRDVEVRVRRIG